MESWQDFGQPSALAILLFLVSVLFYKVLDSRFRKRAPNSYGFHISEVLATQISVQIGQPGNLYWLKEAGLVKERTILDLNPMSESSRAYSLNLLRSAEGAHGNDITYLGDNVYAVDEKVFRNLPKINRFLR